MSPGDLEDAFALLGTEFIEGEAPEETNKQIADACLDLIFQRERLRRGAASPTEVDAVDKETLETLQSWDSRDPSFAVLEKVLRKLATGKGEDAVDYLKKSIQGKLDAISQGQSEKAKKPRPSRRHPLYIAAERIIGRRPDISYDDVIDTLEGMGLIHEVAEGNIYPPDPYGYEAEVRSITVSAMRSRVSKLKKERKTKLC
jgi:hypothetical protein